jgi:hypothetical protein
VPEPYSQSSPTIGHIPPPGALAGHRDECPPELLPEPPPLELVLPDPPPLPELVLLPPDPLVELVPLPPDPLVELVPPELPPLPDVDPLVLLVPPLPELLLPEFPPLPDPPLVLPELLPEPLVDPPDPEPLLPVPPSPRSPPVNVEPPHAHMTAGTATIQNLERMEYLPRSVKRCQQRGYQDRKGTESRH